eukprot:6817898-Alexandrium_andersonii.AAC.1
MDALLLGLFAISVVLGLVKANDRLSDVIREGLEAPNAKPLVDVASCATSVRRPILLDMVQARRVDNDGVFVRRGGH